jgi:GR25 family glycosyltransferase involved in LPS biosynthesis
MTIYFKVHHHFTGSDENNFRDLNTQSINQFLASFCSPINVETVMIRNYQDFNKLDLQNLQTKFVNKRGNRNPPPGWLPGEIGIWLSNISTMREFLEMSQSEVDVCLCFEDDVWLDLKEGGFEKSLQSWMERLPKNWDFLNLYVAENWRYKYDPLVHEIGDEILSKNFAEVHSPALLWSRRGAAKLVELGNREIHSPIDRQLFEDLDFVGFAVKPDQHAGVSVWAHEALNNSTIQKSELRINFPIQN